MQKGNAVKEEVGEGLRILRLWFFAHDGFTEEAEALMHKKGVFWSVGEDLDGLLRSRFSRSLSLPARLGTLSDHLAKMATLPIPLNADLSNHLPKMTELAKLVNTDLSKGFTVSQVAEKNHRGHFFNNSIAPQISKSPLWELEAIPIHLRRNSYPQETLHFC